MLEHGEQGNPDAGTATFTQIVHEHCVALARRTIEQVLLDVAGRR
jgi:hypothetical protein